MLIYVWYYLLFQAMGRQDMGRQEIERQEMRRQEMGRQDMNRQQMGRQDMGPQQMVRQEMRPQQMGRQDMNREDTGLQEMEQQEMPTSKQQSTKESVANTALQQRYKRHQEMMRGTAPDLSEDFSNMNMQANQMNRKNQVIILISNANRMQKCYYF